jgi:uncharacterized protein YaeQ
MAIKPRVFKANIQIADMNQHYYQDHLLTIAQHPSETDERMMVRVLAFALNASDNLSFAEGITDTNHADLWDRDHNEQIALWISVGLPDEKLIRKASIRADQVIVYSYGGRPAEIWWNKLNVSDYANLKVINLSEQDSKELAAMFSRGMKMSFTIQEDDVLITNDTTTLNLTLQKLK